jgi:TPP-dependent 2-oxoacid decarboxylase
MFWLITSQAQINHVESAYSEIKHALSMALIHQKPVYISIASNIAAASHPSLVQESTLFKSVNLLHYVLHLLIDCNVAHKAE